jgi:hypothetical protein
MESIQVRVLVYKLQENIRDGIFKLLRSPRIDSKEWIPPAYVAWRAGTTTLFLLGSLNTVDCSKTSAQDMGLGYLILET